MPDIAALGRVDPSIAARVVQTANSAYFSGGPRCSLVEEAVQRVGYDQIYELVSYAVASQVFVRPVEFYGIEAEELWKMSVVCALAAEVVAERIGADRSVAYTIGLLHAVGMVALDAGNDQTTRRAHGAASFPVAGRGGLSTRCRNRPAKCGTSRALFNLPVDRGCGAAGGPNHRAGRASE
ncbi:MAG: HDOD domain-containing protein [Opitutaceae bacterium]